MPRFKDQAICIRLLDWSETSQIVALLTQQHGKIRGLAKGSKRTSPGAVARFSGGIELLTLGQVVGVTKPSTELATLTEWDLQNPYWHLRRDLAAQRLGLYAADLAGAFLADHDPHPKVFDALQAFLEALAEPARHQAALLAFQWQLLEDCGYRPQLQRDARSGEPLAEQRAYTFDARTGGLVAGGHQASSARRGVWRVRHETIRVLRAVAGGVDPVSVELPFDPEAVARANRLLCVYARAILDRQLPTMPFVLKGQG